MDLRFSGRVVFKVKMGMTLQKNRSKHIDCGSEEDLGSFFFLKMTGHSSFELIEAKSDPISELGNICVSLELLPIRRKCICTCEKIESCNNFIILNKKWNLDIALDLKMVNDLIHG